MSGLGVHIIGDPKRGSTDLAGAGWVEGTRVVSIAPVTARGLVTDMAPMVDLERFRALHGRAPLAAEMGCALAHLNSCSALLASPDTWAIVLEDDALVGDVRVLEARARQVMAAWPTPTPLVFSFFTECDVAPLGLPDGPVPGSLQLPVTLGSAVAYLMNRSAAALILASQQPVWSVADWPVAPPDVAFCLDLGGLVRHDPGSGGGSTISTFSRDPRVLSMFVKAQIWTWVWYVRHQRHFAGASDYRRAMLSRRAFFHRHMRR